MRTRPGLVAAGGGLLATLSVPPFGWWPLGIGGVGALAASLRGCTGGVTGVGRVGSPVGSPVGSRRRFFLGLAFGAALYGPSLFWMTQFSIPGAVIAVAVEAAITALCICVFATGTAMLPIALVAAEVLRERWPFGGAPIGGIDLGQAGGPLAGLAAIGGRLAVVGAVACIGTALASLIGNRGPRLRRSGGLAFVGASSVALLLAACGPIGTHIAGTPLTVAIVQGGGPTGRRAAPALALAAYQAQIAATAGVRQAVDLIVWPEDVVDRVRLAGHDQEVDLALSSIAAHHRATLVTGEVEPEGPLRFRNALVAYGPTGDPVDRYEKIKRVPFGEYFPFRRLLVDLGVNLPKRDAIAGAGPSILHTASGPIAVAVSYEGFFAGRIRSGVRAGGRIVVVATNASSYRSGQVPTQQIAAAQLRARESGRWVVQVAPTGYSALIDPTGHVRWRGPLRDRVVRVVQVPRRTGLTPYGRFGDLPVIVLCAAVVLGWWVRAGRWRRERPLPYRALHDHDLPI